MVRPSKLPQSPPSNWSIYVPAAQRRKVMRLRTWQRIKTRLLSRSFIVSTLLVGYLLVCLYLLLWGSPTVGFLAILPMLLPPPVAYLAYWLLWREFHH